MFAVLGPIPLRSSGILGESIIEYVAHDRLIKTEVRIQVLKKDHMLLLLKCMCTYFVNLKRGQ